MEARKHQAGFFVILPNLSTETNFMRIQLSDERQEMLEMVRQSAKDFTEKNIRPHVMEWDESQHFPVPLFKEMGSLGFMGVLVP